MDIQTVKQQYERELMNRPNVVAWTSRLKTTTT